MRRFVGVRRALCSALFVVAFVAATAAVPETFVDDDFDASTPGWMVTRFAALQPAIDATDPGGFLFVAPGTYTLPLALSVTRPIGIVGPQAGVDPRPSFATTRTQGDPATEAIVQGNGAIGALLIISADAVTVDGLEFRNGLGDLVQSPVAGGPHTDLVLRYCYVSNSSGDEGIQLRHAPGCIIEFNAISNTVGDGIAATQGSRGAIIRSNELHSIHTENAAIYCYDDNQFDEDLDVLIEDNLIRGITVDDAIRVGSAGGVDADLAGGSILNNTIMGVNDDGIVVSASDVFVAGNSISGVTGRAGDVNGAIHLDFPVARVTIVGNSIHDNAFASATSGGIRLAGGVDAGSVIINCNSFENNTPYAVLNDAATPVNAQFNYWGAADGPDDDAGVINGSGDAISLNVDATNFSDSPIVALNEVFVDDDFDSGTPGWQLTHFDAIQPAIDSLCVAGRVHVAAGTYLLTQTIVVDRSIAIVGPQAGVDPRPTFGSPRTPGGPAEAVITGGGALASLLSLEAPNVRIEGLEFTSGTGDLVQSPVAGGPWEGLLFRYNIVSASVGDDGVQLRNAPGCTIEFNRIFMTAGDGITASEGSDGAVIRFNELHGIATVNAAIHVYDDDTFNRPLNALIEGNLIRDTTVASAIRIGSRNGNDADLDGGTVRGNAIVGATNDGIVIAAPNVTLDGNDITGVVGVTAEPNGAIFVERPVAGITLVGNVIHDNALTGGVAGGLLIVGGAPADTYVVSCNSFSANTPYAILNQSAAVLVAENNFWGAADGPDDDDGMINGSGDAISTNVDADPFLATFGDPVATASETMLTFAPADETTTEDMTVGITNDSVCEDLRIDFPGFVLSGDDADHFAVVDPLTFPVALAPGASATFTLRYDPMGEGGVTHTATATLAGTSSADPAIALSGSAPQSTSMTGVAIR